MERALTWNDLPNLMDQARAIARRLLRSERQARSMRASDLVLTGLRRQRLVDQEWDQVTWQSQEDFFAAMYRAMDRALKDHGRRRGAQKRTFSKRLTLDDISPEELLRIARYQPHDGDFAFDESYPDLLDALSEALRQLEVEHPDWAHIARHRYYSELTLEQIAGLLCISERTVRRHWEKARVLLHDQIITNLQRLGYEISARSGDIPASRH